MVGFQPVSRLSLVIEMNLDTLYDFASYATGFLPLDEGTDSRAAFVIVSGSYGWTDGNAFGASKITPKR